ncbi:MAG: alanine--tRNA ligase [Patescibacteria group bacterium]
MNTNEVREKFLEYYKEKGHAVIPSSALVPENDPTTLFTGSGMQPLIPYLLGQKHPLGTRLTNSQKCFRAEDIEEVGDNRHTTFFEMLGNWSLGDYFKEQQLPWFFEFLTKQVGLDPNRLYVTVFSGDAKNNIPKDEESVTIWKRLFAEKGIEAKEGERVFYYDAKKNWWSRAGAPENMPSGEPGGPDSEVFYDFAIPHNTQFGKNCHPNCDCGRFLEIGNSVFMEYKKREDGTFEKLSQRNVDFGGGLERMCAASNGDSDIFTIDTLSAVIRKIEELSGASYKAKTKENTSPAFQKSFRVIADHIRGAVFMIGDGVLPSNTDRGYFVRRLLRRAVRHADVLGMKQGMFAELALPIIESYADQYPELHQRQSLIQKVISDEEEKFRQALKKGYIAALKKFFNKAIGGVDPENLPKGMRIEGNVLRVSGEEVFNLRQTYGMPIEVSQEIMKEWGVEFDEQTINEEREAFKKHQEISRAGVEKKFKGGLADTSKETVRLHTAHHLLLAALRKVLGEHVHQRGSNITAERLRIDFSHPQKMTAEELEQAEGLVNQKIAEKLDMIRQEMPKEEALKVGAEMEFGVKYGDVVSVYFAQDKHGNVFSKEFCGGPHVANTGELGHFKIIKEEAVSSGIRRIRAVLE